MYILVKDSVDPGHAALACAHGALGGYLDFVKLERETIGSPTPTERWAAESFRKCACSVTGEQFEKAKSYGKPGEDYRVMTESGLGGMEVAIVFRPKVEWEPFFRSLRLWGKI